MALTKKDLQLIRETLKPDFDTIQKKFEEVDYRFDNVDKRFDRLEGGMTGMENTLTAAFREIVNDMYDLHPSKEEFNHLDGRVTVIEQKIH